MRKSIDNKVISFDPRTGLLRTRSFLNNNISRRGFGRGAAAAGAAAAIAGSMPKAAKADGDLTYVGWQGYDDGINANGWFESQGITLQPTYITAGNEEIIALLQSGGKGNVDLTSPCALYMPFYAEVGIAAPIDLDRVPNYANLFPEFQGMPMLEFDGQVWGTPYTWGTVSLMYNPALVEETPTSWMDMMDPRYQGKVAFVHDLIGVMPSFIATAGNTRTPWLVDQATLDKATDLIIQIKKEYALTVAPGYGDLGTLFSTGDIVMAPGWEPTTMWGGAEAVELKWLIPKEGALVFVDNLSIVPGAPEEDLAYAAINQSLSAEAQATCSNLNATGAVVKDAVPMIDEKIRSLYPYDDIGGWFEAAGGITQLWPTNPDGEHVTFADVTAAWERFLSA